MWEKCDKQPLPSAVSGKVELHCGLWQLHPKRQKLFEGKRLANPVVIFFCLHLSSIPLIQQVTNSLFTDRAGRLSPDVTLDIFLNFTVVNHSMTKTKQNSLAPYLTMILMPTKTILNHNSGFPQWTVLTNSFNIMTFLNKTHILISLHQQAQKERRDSTHPLWRSEKLFFYLD